MCCIPLAFALLLVNIVFLPVLKIDQCVLKMVILFEKKKKKKKTKLYRSIVLTYTLITALDLVKVAGSWHGSCSCVVCGYTVNQQLSFIYLLVMYSLHYKIC